MFVFWQRLEAGPSLFNQSVFGASADFPRKNGDRHCQVLLHLQLGSLFIRLRYDHHSF